MAEQGGRFSRSQKWALVGAQSQAAVTREEEVVLGSFYIQSTFQVRTEEAFHPSEPLREGFAIPMV